MKKIILSLLLCFSFLIPSLVKAEDICFSEDTTKDMVVELERGRILEKQIGLYQEANAELEKQITLLNKVIELKDQQLDVAQETNEQYKDLLTTQQEVYNDMMKDVKSNNLKNLITQYGLIVTILAIVLL